MCKCCRLRRSQQPQCGCGLWDGPQARDVFSPSDFTLKAQLCKWLTAYIQNVQCRTKRRSPRHWMCAMITCQRANATHTLPRSVEVAAERNIIAGKKIARPNLTHYFPTFIQMLWSRLPIHHYAVYAHKHKLIFVVVFVKVPAVQAALVSHCELRNFLCSKPQL